MGRGELSAAVRAALVEHGKDWPGGLIKEIADRFGSTSNSVRVAKNRLWEKRKKELIESSVEELLTPPAPPVQPEPLPTPEPEPAPAAEESRSDCDAAPEHAAAPLELPPLADHHKGILESSAITGERVKAWGTLTKVEQLPEQLRSWGTKALPCMATEWLTVAGRRVPQLRLDTPITTRKGDRIRYLFPKGEGGIVGTDAEFERDWDNINIPMLLVEGTKQFQAAASVINPNHPIAIPFGIAGCWGWSHDFKPSADLRALPADGRDVFVAFDADVSTNWMVWEAARRLERYLKQELGARSVRFLDNPGVGGDKDGLDDFLGRQPTVERRINRLRHLIDSAIEHKNFKAPSKPVRDSSFFKGSNLQTADCFDYLAGAHHLALSGDQSVAVYHQGVYWNGTSLWWSRLIGDTLGNDYKSEHEHNLTKKALARLKTDGRKIGFQQPRPVINFRNCLLDALTMEQRPHTPEHLTLVQLPHEWDPKAECPRFLQWVEEVAPGQLDSLLDVSSQMLDLAEWPRMIVFLTGPTRSGKSTWIRILNALVGPELRSNVSLHDLSKGSDDKFATSSLFGKVLNTFADLSASDLQDLSTIKVLTGGDEFEAQRKNGHRFTMRNQAMLVFSANSIPATSENSGAFLARVAHFEFPHSFVGKEDKTIEDHIIDNELPGVLRLMVESLHRRKARGNFLPLDQTRQQRFAEKTDRVRMFLADRTRPGDHSRRCIKKSELYSMFLQWLEEENPGKKPNFGKHKFNERVRLAGVGEFTPKGWTKCWDLLPCDDETTALPPVETTDPSNSLAEPLITVNEGGNASDEFDGFKEASASETADHQTDCSTGGEVKKGGSASADSAVLPHCTASTEKSSQQQISLQCIGTADTTDRLITPAEPQPFVGDCPEGIVYVLDPIDLPVLPAGGSYGFDLETFNRRTDQWRHVAALFPQLGGEIRLAQVCDGQTTWVIDVALMGQPAVDWLKALARDSERTLVGHNLLFEAQFLMSLGIRPLCRWWDSMLASQVIGDLPRHNLKAVALHYLGEDIDKTEQTSNWGGALTASQLEYAALDARIVLPLGRELHKHLHQTGQVNTHRLDCQMINPCADSQVRGLHVKQEVLLPIKKQATAERAEKVKELHQLLGLPERTENRTEPYRNPAMLVPAMSKHLGVELTERKLNRETKKWEDRPSCSSNALEPYEGAAAVDLLTAIRDLDCTLKEIKWLQRDAEISSGRIHPSYSILGAETGRTTTKAQLGQNDKLRNVPSDTAVYKSGKRKGQPRDEKLPQWGFNFQGLTGRSKAALGTGNDDTVLLDVDWTSQEIRLQASPRLYNDAGQRQIVFDNLDPHCHIASQVCGREITEKDPERKTIGKPANFSLAYGCGAQSLERQMKAVRGDDYRPGEGQRAYDAWHQFHPQCSAQMKRFKGTNLTECRSVSGRRVRKVSKTAGSDGLVTAYPLSPQKGVNYPIQSTGRDLLADALGDLWPALDQFPGAHVVGLIHDEVLLEVPRSSLEEVKAQVVEAMTSDRLKEKYLGDVPLDVDANVAENWGDAH